MLWTRNWGWSLACVNQARDFPHVKLVCTRFSGWVWRLIRECTMAYDFLIRWFCRPKNKNKIPRFPYNCYKQKQLCCSPDLDLWHHCSLSWIIDLARKYCFVIARPPRHRFNADCNCDDDDDDDDDERHWLMGHILYHFLLIPGAMQRNRDLSDLWVVYWFYLIEDSTGQRWTKKPVVDCRPAVSWETHWIIWLRQERSMMKQMWI
jgi:hypothetical protein